MKCPPWHAERNYKPANWDGQLLAEACRLTRNTPPIEPFRGFTANLLNAKHSNPSGQKSSSSKQAVCCYFKPKKSVFFSGVLAVSVDEPRAVVAIYAKGKCRERLVTPGVIGSKTVYSGGAF